MRSDKTLLILPTHVATVDPVMMFTEFMDTRLQPLVDEAYFKNPLFARVLSHFDAIEVPDLKRNRNGVDQIKRLNSITHDSLAAGKNVIFYPSGHITTDGTEKIGSRSLTYDTCANLPDNVEVLGVRIKGLWGSMWSRYGRRTTPPFGMNIIKSIGLILCGWVFIKPKRKVDIIVEPITDQVKEWAATLDKKQFNEKLEAYYNR